VLGDGERHRTGHRPNRRTPVRSLLLP
jgi:hypothetical protein